MRYTWIARTVAVFVFAATLASTATDGWLTDFAEAKRVAAEKKLTILMDFSGSDWCIWCKRLSSEVFSQEAFKDYAKDNLVLFLADFPMRTEQSDVLRTQNRKLQSSYRVAGYPTVLLVNANGEELARTGYVKGGAEAYVTHLKGLLEGKKTDAPPAGH